MVDDATAPFDALYRISTDPWGTTTRWYEQRKRWLLLASLPRERYGTIYEAGCGTGHISSALADRCDALLASDGSATALAIATRTLAGRDSVTTALHRLPQEWPARSFDLIVLSEVLYFVDATACRDVATSARASAGATGTVLTCDWRDAIEGHGHRGDEVHRRFEAALGLPRLFEYIDSDFVLTGWSVDTVSVATREGLRRCSFDTASTGSVWSCLRTTRNA